VGLSKLFASHTWNKEDPVLKNDLMKLVRWFCLKLTYNDLASVVPMLQERLTGSRKDLDLKPDEERPPHYRQFRVDSTPPLTKPPVPEEAIPDWHQLQKEHQKKTGKRIGIVRRRDDSPLPPEKCVCAHCNAPARYLYLNNGKIGSQVKCKICRNTSPTDKPRRESKAKYWCPHCGGALFRWKEDGICTAYKCPNKQCGCYRRNLTALTPEENRMRQQGNTSQFKLHYLFREYHFASEALPLARPEQSPVDLNRIHHSLHTVGQVLTLTVSFGLSARMCAQAMKHLFDVRISHQTVINYTNAAAAQLSGFVDANSPKPDGPCAADETYIKINGITRYTWFIVSKIRRAICGWNLSDSRESAPALGLIYTCYGPPDHPVCTDAELITDGLPSYDSAVVAYNSEAMKHGHLTVLNKRTVIGLRNLDPESEAYREYKQLVERLNRTYKFHTRPRAGFKDFDGAVALTTLFVAYYNFMRPHGSLKNRPPVELECLQGKTLHPDQWVELLRQAA
jgi:putative transposase